jgi:hypothetical protein
MNHPEWFLESSEIENASLTRTTITNEDDDPKTNWKNRVPERTPLFKWPRA